MTDLQPGTVTIGDLYREIVGMRADMARALTRIEVIDHQNGDADRLHADHEARLRALEAFRWKLTGLAVSLGSAAGVVSGIIAARVH